MTDLPDPPVPEGCDLRGMPYMPLDSIRLFDSDFYVLSTGEEFKAGLSLWCKAFLQQPPGSLPSDDRLLAHLSGAGQRWKHIKDMALRGWYQCSDGRLYHKVVSEKVADAWKARCDKRARTEAARAARAAQRGGSDNTPPPSGTTPTTDDVTRPDTDNVTKRRSNIVTFSVTENATSSVTDNVTPSNIREGKGREGKQDKKEDMGLRPDADAPPMTPKDRLKSEGIAVYRQMTGCSEKDAYSQIFKLCKIADQQYEVVLDAIDDAVRANPLRPMGFISDAISRRMQRQTPAISRKLHPSAPKPDAREWIDRLAEGSFVPLLDMPIGGNG